MYGFVYGTFLTLWNKMQTNQQIDWLQPTNWACSLVSISTLSISIFDNRFRPKLSTIMTCRVGQHRCRCWNTSSRTGQIGRTRSTWYYHKSKRKPALLSWWSFTTGNHQPDRIPTTKTWLQQCKRTHGVMQPTSIAASKLSTLVAFGQQQQLMNRITSIIGALLSIAEWMETLWTTRSTTATTSPSLPRAFSTAERNLPTNNVPLPFTALLMLARGTWLLAQGAQLQNSRRVSSLT